MEIDILRYTSGYPIIKAISVYQYSEVTEMSISYGYAEVQGM
ncbi:hypothetical protein [Peribacillus tepidiphilus]|nr:hypothetical protein [Peribacillus tepidiphilus]